MWKVFTSVFAGFKTADAGISIAERFGERYKRLVPGFLFRKDYYFEEVNKKVFVKSNGNGVVVCSYDLYVIRPKKIENFIRIFDISDAPHNTLFPQFKSIKKQLNGNGRKINFFNEFALWCESENGIILQMEEDKEDKDFTQEQLRKRSEKRLLGVKYFVDKSKLKAKQKYRIIYGYSVPKLFPINNGRHDASEYKKRSYIYTTSLSVKHMAKKLRMAVYLENGMCIQQEPCGKTIKASNNAPTDSDICEMRENILYKKYLYEVKRPEKYSSIKLEWRLK